MTAAQVLPASRSLRRRRPALLTGRCVPSARVTCHLPRESASTLRTKLMLAIVERWTRTNRSRTPPALRCRECASALSCDLPYEPNGRRGRLFQNTFHQGCPRASASSSSLKPPPSAGGNRRSAWLVVCFGGLGGFSPLQPPVNFVSGGVPPLAHPVLKPWKQHDRDRIGRRGGDRPHHDLRIGGDERRLRGYRLSDDLDRVTIGARHGTRR